MQRARGGSLARRILEAMSYDAKRIAAKFPGFRALLDALGVDIVDGRVTVPFELGPGSARIHVAAVGWATVELDRADERLSIEFATTFEPTVRDALLGASVRRSTADGPGILILEPDTEGRLAGALAKHGEGPIALYLRVPSLAQLPRQLSIRAGNGPLGPARLVLGGAAWGPFLILVGPPGPPPQDADRVPSGS